ncbi:MULTISPECIES: TldD/PmbA family protein [Terrabacteria group]|uniref:TldD/PmbA family protein n=1 Tax=Bacillati TaxID=1783272 RepID=UPI001C6F32E7|nr:MULTISPECIES: TldD/PmbA family protein [Terrabacteria group]MBW9212004.1 TldD/PmbA family protein [Trueperella sp. zg.1013]
MKVPFSEYLQKQASSLKEVIQQLNKKYDYVSILSSDSYGLDVNVLKSATQISSKTLASERGIVIRVCQDGQYAEYAFNTNDLKNPSALAKEIEERLSEQSQLLNELHVQSYKTAILSDEPCELFVEKEAEQLVGTADTKSLVEKLETLGKKIADNHEEVIEYMVASHSTHVNKMFLTMNRDLRQSYEYSEAYVVSMVQKNGKVKQAVKTASGLKGPEIIDELAPLIDQLHLVGNDLLSAERVEPGEYEVITSPEITGLIAHEAFGHGVEMDMFVKDRAIGKEFIGKRVASDLVSMHEGALIAENVTSYAFDDEGTLAQDTLEINHGILETGICDALSALRLGVQATGNGKRENFEHKVYTRMTNTVFDSGTDSVEDMIASIKHGYLLEEMASGMEDPKHWGIQCMVGLGREIKDGKLTGKVVAPLILTGYVPDVLGNISMTSPDRLIFGAGACGKGHKEWVKVTDGGPYLKTKVRLG